jgi:hypothetical protein
MLTGIPLLGLAIAGLPQRGSAQSDPFLGTWQFNLGKSKYSSDRPRSGAVNFQADGQNLKGTFTGTDANGNPINFVITYVLDGMPHPADNPNPNYDAAAHTRVDAYTLIRSITKSGKLVGIQPITVSPDGKTLTFTVIGTNANFISVFDKQ